MTSRRLTLDAGPFAADTDSQLGAIAAGLDAENRVFLLSLRDEWRALALSPDELRAMRNDAIRALVDSHYRALPSTHSRAQALASDLAHETAMRVDALPGSKRHALREVLNLNRGSPLSWRALFDVLTA